MQVFKSDWQDVESYAEEIRLCFWEMFFQKNETFTWSYNLLE